MPILIPNGVSKTGKHVATAGLDRPPRVDRLARREHARDAAVADGQAARHDRVGLHDPTLADEQVGLHGAGIGFTSSP